MLKNVTITLSAEAAHWARRKAADANTSVSRLVGEMLERQMRQSDEYAQAFEGWKAHLRLAPRPATDRAPRAETHERRHRG